MRQKITLTLLLAFSLTLILGMTTFAKQYEGSPPEQFQQAPELSTLVKEGELPPVAERLPKPEDLYVVEPIEKIGEYGGTIRTTTLTSESYGDDTILSTFPNPVQPKIDGSGVVPNVAKELVSSDDKKVWTMYLREGMKWSDGHPFTADDVLFWYNDVLLNKDLIPAVPARWKTKGEVMEVTKLGDYAVKFVFQAPKPYFPERLTHVGAWNLFFPKHYLKQFHPAYVGEETVAEKAKEEGFDHWYQLFWDKNSHVWGLPLNKDRPTICPYVLEKKTSDRRVYTRNPYYWKVDTAGNQLPYLDGIVAEIVTDVEVVQGMIMSGEIDFAGIQAGIRNYPMYKKYENEGGYRTILWESGMGSDVIYMPNQTNEDPVLREIFQDVRFRKALSLAIDREEISDSIYFGKAEPRQYTVLESSKHYKPEFAKAYTEYDPQRAKKLLDDMGLVDENGDGWRERPDGKNLNFTIEYYTIETPKQPNVELVSQYWREIGMKVESRAISGELQEQRATANLMDMTLWHGDRGTDIYFPVDPHWIIPLYPSWARTIGPEWARWFQTEGKSGIEPPAKVKELYGWWEEVLSEPDKERRMELCEKILRSQAENLWCIGTVGASPYPVVVDSDIRNFPEKGLWVWDTLWTMSQDPSQLFFEGGEDQGK